MAENPSHFYCSHLCLLTPEAFQEEFAILHQDAQLAYQVFLWKELGLNLNEVSSILAHHYKNTTKQQQFTQSETHVFLGIIAMHG